MLTFGTLSTFCNTAPCEYKAILLLLLNAVTYLRNIYFYVIVHIFKCTENRWFYILFLNLTHLLLIGFISSCSNISDSIKRFVKFLSLSYVTFIFKQTTDHFNQTRIFVSNFVFRWPQHVLRLTEHICTHSHVLLLYGGGDGSWISKIHLVEEIFN